MNTRWSEYDYQAWLAKNNPRAAVQAANSKSIGRTAVKASIATEEIHPRFRIKIHHRSRRLADATGRSHKAAVDGLVRGGILPDDSPKYLESITETYEIAATNDTIIEIEEIK